MIPVRRSSAPNIASQGCRALEFPPTEVIGGFVLGLAVLAMGGDSGWGEAVGMFLEDFLLGAIKLKISVL